MASIAFFLVARAKAQAAGDRGGVRVANAELARLGYVESPPLPEVAEPAATETTALAMPERAVQPARRGRPPRTQE